MKLKQKGQAAGHQIYNLVLVFENNRRQKRLMTNII